MTTRSQRGSPAEIAPDLLELGHEPSDVSPRAISYALLGLFAALILFGALLAAMFLAFRHHEDRPPVSALRATMPQSDGPHLEASPSADRAEIEAAAKARLDGYGWSDRAAGRAHIPIEEAMRLTAERGWPDGQEGAKP